MDEISPESLTYKPPTQAVKEAFAKFPNNFTDEAINGFLKKRSGLLGIQVQENRLKQQTLTEWGIAWVLANWKNLEADNKPVLKDDKYLRVKLGIDPARIVRFLTLELAYPKGISLDNEKIVLALENNQRGNLIEVIQIIPGYQNFDEEQLNLLLTRLGFSENKAGGNWISQLSQTDLSKLILEIVNTNSIPLKK